MSPLNPQVLSSLSSPRVVSFGCSGCRFREQESTPVESFNLSTDARRRFAGLPQRGAVGRVLDLTPTAGSLGRRGGAAGVCAVGCSGASARGPPRPPPASAATREVLAVNTASCPADCAVMVTALPDTTHYTGPTPPATRSFSLYPSRFVTDMPTLPDGALAPAMHRPNRCGCKFSAAGGRAPRSRGHGCGRSFRGVAAGRKR